MKSVFSYTDFRSLLADFYKERKSQGSYSYRSFSERAGIRSPNFLKLIIDGKKALTVENIHRFAKAMELRPFETEYFEALVFFSQANVSFEKDYYRQRMQKIKSTVSDNERPRSFVALMSDWYLPAVLSALDEEPVDVDINVVAKKCGVLPVVISRAIELLLQQGALRCISGQYRICHQHINLEDRKASSRAHREFLKKQLQLSKRAFDKSYGKGAKFISQTFTCSKASLELYNDQIHMMMDALYKLSDQDERTDIAQVNVQLFTLDQI